MAVMRANDARGAIRGGFRGATGRRFLAVPGPGPWFRLGQRRRRKKVRESALRAVVLGAWSKLRRQASLPLPRFRGCDVVWEGGGGSSSAWSCGEDGAVEGSSSKGDEEEGRCDQKKPAFSIDKTLGICDSKKNNKKKYKMLQQVLNCHKTQSIRQDGVLLASCLEAKVGCRGEKRSEVEVVWPHESVVCPEMTGPAGRFAAGGLTLTLGRDQHPQPNPNPGGGKEPQLPAAAVPADAS